MIDIIIDENGTPRNYLENKNEDIKAELLEVLNKFVEEKELMMGMKKATKLGYRFAKQLWKELIRYPRMTAEQFSTLDYDTLNEWWIWYCEIIAHYNEYFEIVDNKQLFCAYMGINTRQYSRLEHHEDEDVRNLMGVINDTFVGQAWTAIESGNADAKATTSRLRAGGEAGHSVISAVEEKIIETSEGMSETEFEARLAQRGVQLLN